MKKLSSLYIFEFVIISSLAWFSLDRFIIWWWNIYERLGVNRYKCQIVTKTPLRKVWRYQRANHKPYKSKKTEKDKQDNDLQNTTPKTNLWATQTPQKSGVNPDVSEMHAVPSPLVSLVVVRLHVMVIICIAGLDGRVSIILACFRILSCSSKYCVYCNIIPVYHE
jgi:hypothetical protein